MKKIVFILCAFVMTFMGYAQDKLNFQAEIANRNGDILFIKNNKGRRGILRERTLSLFFDSDVESE